MKKASTSAPSEPDKDDLQPEYRFGYRKAKPNRFAGMSMARCLKAIAAAPLRPKMIWDSLKAVTRKP